MKKNSLVAIKTALTNFGFADEDIMAELTAEINKGEEQKAKNAAVYASFHDIVMKALAEATAPVTIAELYEEIKGELPEGFTKAKVQYALGHYWEAEVVKTEGKVNTYTRK